MAQTKETPLNKQYNQIKAKYPGAMLLFRVGDFYETFGEDAIKASKILGIVLTRRNNGGSNDELAGFPHHSLDTYLPKLVRAGQRVAICDQLEDPKTVKGIVKRGVTELVTPGVSFNDNVLDVRQNNYLASLHFASEDLIGVAFLDISTGEFFTTQGSLAYVDKLIQGFSPAEILYCKKHKKRFEQVFGEKYNTYTFEDWVFTYDFAYDQLIQHFKTNNLKGFGVENLQEGVTAAGVILQYLKDTEHREVDHINRLTRLDQEQYVWLDRFTIRNLELLFSPHEGGVPLIDILDQTVTPMGARLLRKWLVLPLKNKAQIEERLNTVQYFAGDDQVLQNLIQVLKPIGDLERLVSKVAVRRINPREMVQLKKALAQIEPLKELLVGHPSMEKLTGQLNDCKFLVEKIERELRDDAPTQMNQGGMIKTGVDAPLDELHKIAFSGKDYLVDIQNRESERTGIPSLKIAYNKVFGYYLEVSNAHKDKVPQEWIRKQTLVNAERYITEELKVYEEQILTAESKINEIEFRIFNELVLTAAEYVNVIQENARVISNLDALLSFARVALKNGYARPVITEEKRLDIKGGRHPVIEQQLPTGESYVPNDLYLDDEEQQIIIITGPNMAGKSALLRQTALIVLMAQIGSFVPAASAEVGIVDKIFTRVGANDNLSRGESTFMVEMTETASILNNLGDRSLVIMDEIGRGTSTYDGVSIAWSIAEYLHNHKKQRPRTLFATHYHELNNLSNDFPRIKNFNVAVKEMNGKVVFLRKLKEGGSEHSFGIHVAQLAGMPQSVVLRANEILQELEKSEAKEKNKAKISEAPKNNFQLNFFDPVDPVAETLKEKIKAMDLNAMSPIEALLKLNDLQNLVKG
ncbi:DNA mismatch repair protein MutS [Leadbetterella byssophila DSM 17132]|uniref:DNA mismatch repair protein MutS n=1 Tax=Leadbetterella byssophila (strain DSM 17132 / JCM 16389 / KACC 11308 / NBRC 106382 / 4M15) TaxID=649349 RepID=E4RQ88_LEAB4|nr:DNA mismatch repair protein MutS [Leadbetterella byssophila]ADQ17463.1 DNA mismatch repair protein MutS [Leadbetterella byssophila DSM 17132]